jgi:hypothetical protein
MLLDWTLVHAAMSFWRVYWTGSSIPGRSHSERFMWRRPELTWSITNQDTGATLLYQGQTVLFEWQSAHARAKIFAWRGGTVTAAARVRASSIGGLVRAGRISWIAAVSPRMPSMTPRKKPPIYVHFIQQGAPANAILVHLLHPRPSVNNAQPGPSALNSGSELIIAIRYRMALPSG